jgi:hypothetical protein
MPSNSDPMEKQQTSASGFNITGHRFTVITHPFLSIKVNWTTVALLVVNVNACALTVV